MQEGSKITICLKNVVTIPLDPNSKSSKKKKKPEKTDKPENKKKKATSDKKEVKEVKPAYESFTEFKKINELIKTKKSRRWMKKWVLQPNVIEFGGEIWLYKWVVEEDYDDEDNKIQSPNSSEQSFTEEENVYSCQYPLCGKTFPDASKAVIRFP
jgi:hypothetical protein